MERDCALAGDRRKEECMSGYILCQVKRAQKPFYIENISTNIYSIEELCYYLYHDLNLVDSTVINGRLCTWLDEELGLTRLAAKLRPFTEKAAAAEDILYPVFKEINYLSYEELRSLNSRILALNGEHMAVRAKKKGDTLVENGMYVNAIRVYGELLERDDLEQIQQGITSRILHNQGCAYSYLFQMEKALECFWKAYQAEKTPENMKTYLLAYRNFYSHEDYTARLDELEVPEELRKSVSRAWVEFSGPPEETLPEGRTDHVLETLTREYHRSTGS